MCGGAHRRSGRDILFKSAFCTGVGEEGKVMDGNKVVSRSLSLSQLGKSAWRYIVVGDGRRLCDEKRVHAVVSFL